MNSHKTMGYEKMRHEYRDMVDEVVKIYKGNCVPGDGCPVVVTASGRIDDDLVGEYYVFVCDQAATLYQKAVSATSPAAYMLKDDNQTTVDSSVMIGLLANLAEEKLNNHLYEMGKREATSSLLGQVYRLEECPDNKHLLYLYLRGAYNPRLHRIAQNTKFIRLSRLIGSLEVLQVANISESEGGGSA